MLAALGVAAPVMSLTMSTVHTAAPPPPLADPLHWLTEETSWLELTVVLVQVSVALVAPLHASTVTVELVVPVATSRLLVTVTRQWIS